MYQKSNASQLFTQSVAREVLRWAYLSVCLSARVWGVKNHPETSPMDTAATTSLRRRAQDNAPAALHWLGDVLDDDGRHCARGAGHRGWNLQCSSLIYFTWARNGIARSAKLKYYYAMDIRPCLGDEDDPLSNSTKCQNIY